MTAPETPSTAVTVPQPDEDRSIVGQLPEALQASIRLRKLANASAAKLAAQNWGKDMDEGTRRAVANWCHVNDVDPATEFELLGNKFYKNAAWHLRKLAELAAQGVVEYAVADHVNNDLRLITLGKSGDPEMEAWAKAEDARRIRERVTRQIPDEATGACLFRIKLYSMAQEVVGVAWAGGGTKSKVVSGGAIKASDAFDPIGTAEPVKTTESRAARRAIRLLAYHAPDLAKQLEQGMGDTADLQVRIQRDKELNRRPDPITGQPVAIPRDPYARPQVTAGAPPAPAPAPAAEPVSTAEVVEAPPAPAADPDQLPLIPEEQAPPPVLTEDEQRALDLAEDARTAAADAEREAEADRLRSGEG